MMINKFNMYTKICTFLKFFLSIFRSCKIPFNFSKIYLISFKILGIYLNFPKISYYFLNFV